MNIIELKCESCYAPLDSTRQHSKVIVCGYCGTENVLSNDIRCIVAEYSHEFMTKLVDSIMFSFGSLDEIRYLINRLDGELDYFRVNYDDIPGRSTVIKSLELVQWCYHRNVLQELVDVCLALRPRMEI